MFIAAKLVMLASIQSAPRTVGDRGVDKFLGFSARVPPAEG